MAISAIFFLDVKGRVIVHRDYRGDISPKYAERFMTKLTELEENSKLTPIIADEGVSYIYLQSANLYILAVTRSNVNAAAIVVFLHRLVEVLKHYFQELEEESLRDNFVIVYELLDEVMDYGFPQFTEAKILNEFIKTDAYKMETAVRPPLAVTNAVSWRVEGIKHKKNEVFLDAVESVHLLVNSNGTVVLSEVRPPAAVPA
ncbi:Mu1-adaptin, partial [Haematococcus lacustris]